MFYMFNKRTFLYNKNVLAKCFLKDHQNVIVLLGLIKKINY